MPSCQVDFCPARYDDPKLAQQVGELLEASAAGCIGRGSRVLLKPNLLIPVAPDTAVVTHPAIVRSAALWALDHGATVRVGDSPAAGRIQRIFKTTGLERALSDLPVALVPFEHSEKRDIGAPFGRIEICREVLAADAIINLPKLKTHCHMRLTLAVKNMFGCVVGLRKPQWHFRSGVDREYFARLLVQLCRAIAPVVSLLDGVVAMQGSGPGVAGTPRNLNILAASANPFALDAAICEMIGLNPMKLPTHAAAVRLSLAPTDVAIHGPMPSVKDFQLPPMVQPIYGPARLHRFMRRYVIQKPMVVPRRCRLCDACLQLCPAKAIRRSADQLIFNYDGCIRCYCCVEVCPHAALKLVDPPLGRVIRMVRHGYRHWRPKIKSAGCREN